MNAAVRARDRYGATAADAAASSPSSATSRASTSSAGTSAASSTSAPIRSSRDGAASTVRTRPAVGAAELERGIVRQDRALERLQRLRRLEPEAPDERLPRRAVGLERLGLAARAVEREHLLPAEALAQRVLGDERLELGRRAAAWRPSASSASIRSSSAARRSSSSRSHAAVANDS